MLKLHGLIATLNANDKQNAWIWRKCDDKYVITFEQAHEFAPVIELFHNGTHTYNLHAKYQPKFQQTLLDEFVKDTANWC